MRLSKQQRFWTLSRMLCVGLTLSVHIALHTKSNSHIHPSDSTVECEDKPPKEAGTLGDPLPQYLHGNHSGNQSRWRGRR